MVNNVPEPTTGRRARGWNWWIIRIADVPWGLALAAIAVYFIVAGGDGLEKGKAMLMAAGLFGIGHGIHTAAKVMRA
jgi:hypothetical protein